MRIAALLVLTIPLLWPIRAQLVTSAQPTGSHGLRNGHYQLFLRPRAASNRDGERIILYPQQRWKCMAGNLKTCRSAFD
jgi:hypothetical protein